MADLYISNVPESSKQTLNVICAVFLSIAWVTVFLRIWARAGLLRNFGWDDAGMVLTNCVFTCFCAFTIWTTELAASGDIQDFSIGKMMQLTKGIISAFTLYVMTMILFKIALAIFYFRIVVRRWQKNVIYVALAVNTTYGLFYFFIVLFRCGDPSQYLRNQLLGKCLSNEVLFAVNLTSGVINAATDWALAILPIFVLKNAGLPFRTSLAACFVLMLGSVGSVVSVVRLPYIKGLAMGPEFFVNVVDTTIWSVIEPGIGITAACLATLRPLFKCMIEGTRAAQSRSRSSSNPLGPRQPMNVHPERPERPDRTASFSTWRSEQMKHAGYEEVELQQRLEERPTFQDRLNSAKAEEEAKNSFATSRTRVGESSIYSDRTHSIKSAETRNFSRPMMPHVVTQLAPPPMPGNAFVPQRNQNERAPGTWEHQHGRQKSKQTL